MDLGRSVFPKFSTGISALLTIVFVVHPDSDFECAAVLMEHTQDVKAVAWHPHEDVRSLSFLDLRLLTLSCQILASASYDDTIKIYLDDPSDDWYCATTISGHASTVWSLAWSPNGEYLASASDDRTVRIWRRPPRKENQGQRWASHQESDGGEWMEVLKLEKHTRSVYSVTWGTGLGEGHLGWIASAGGDGFINIWEIKVCRQSRIMPIEHY
jgi:cytosolic iron-sulfur protein assembly protein CIAO1